MANNQPSSICRPCADSLARIVQQDGIWPGLTAAGARMARSMALEDGEVPTSAAPTLALHQRLSLSHPVSPRQHAHRSRNTMSRLGNYYARNRRDAKSRQPDSPPPPPAQTTDKTPTKTAPPHPGPFDDWANRHLANGGDITTARTTYRRALADHEAGHRSR